MKMKTSSKIYTALIFVFLFAPIAVLVFFSFNSAKSLSVFDEFSLKWYIELFSDEITLGALRNTLVLALTAACVSTVMGTAAALGIYRLRSRYMRAVMNTVTNIPMINPDIITGISMMLLFVKFIDLGFVTVLIAHITFSIPYVILNVLPKLKAAGSISFENGKVKALPKLKNAGVIIAQNSTLSDLSALENISKLCIIDCPEVDLKNLEKET